MSRFTRFLIALFIITSGTTIGSSYADPFAIVTADTLRADFPFPPRFVADSVIAIYDTNGNGFIDSYPADSSATFPYQLTPSTITLGSKLGSPFVVIPGFNQADFGPGFSGKAIIYAEQIDNGWTYFM